jgi:hypothetical protein
MSEVYIDKKGIAHDDEGHSWSAPGFSRGVYSGTHIRPRSKFGAQRKRPEINRDKLDALYLALYYEPKNRILSYAAKVLAKGGEVNSKEAKQIIDIMKKNGMKKEAKLFEDRGIGMRKLLGRLEEKVSDRDNLIKAIYKRFSPSDKMKRGGKHKVMFTGDVAKVLNKGAYTSAFLQDLSDEELHKLAKLLGGKTEDIIESTGDQYREKIDTEGGTPKEKKKLKEVEAKLYEVEKKAVSMEKMFTSDGMKKVNSNMAFKKAMKNRSVVFKRLTGDWSASAMAKKRQSEVDAYQAYIDAMNKVVDEYKGESPALRKAYLR